MRIPEPAKERLLSLMRFLEKTGDTPITSAEVEALTGWSSHTIRKDISYLAGGQAVGSSAGYTADSLVPAIRKALGFDRRRRFCVVGLGRLGSAYLNAGGLDLEEFDLCAGFDTNVNRVEILKSPAPLYPAYKMAEVIQRFSIEIALLCVPAEAAQGAAEKLAAAGIRGILNFAPVALRLSPEVAVRNVYVVDELRSLAIKMEDTEEQHETGI
ncbi:MAG: redox-sensing transcriptional repressor Rex [Treponema sp.]|jgi:redox-sensing transcriptional repressor|nr:redox-sensing transcriptional repressor Rex [Treponema sp.]